MRRWPGELCYLAQCVSGDLYTIAQWFGLIWIRGMASMSWLIDCVNSTGISQYLIVGIKVITSVLNETLCHLIFWPTKTNYWLVSISATSSVIQISTLGSTTLYTCLGLWVVHTRRLELKSITYARGEAMLFPVLITTRFQFLVKMSQQDAMLLTSTANGKSCAMCYSFIMDQELTVVGIRPCGSWAKTYARLV